MIKVFIVDDHNIVREGLKQIISECPDIQVTGEAANSQQLFDIILKDDADLSFIDFNEMGRKG